MKETHAEFIEKAKKEYRKIGSISCAAFGGEHVYFNKYGFDHLIWKGKKMRSPYEQIKRISLVPKAIETIRTSRNFISHRKMERTSHTTKVISTAHFWSLKHVGDVETATVIIRQTNNGHKHFFSVMMPNRL